MEICEDKFSGVHPVTPCGSIEQPTSGMLVPEKTWSHTLKGAVVVGSIYNLQMSTMVQCSYGQFFICFVAWPWKDNIDTIKCAIRSVPSGQQKWMYQYFFKSTSLSLSEKVGIVGIISFFFSMWREGKLLFIFPQNRLSCNSICT